jgi:pimeloyl-ACP methyl ester carboxylesterase
MAELTRVHSPVNSSDKPRIVFIHGLDGDFRATWMSNPKDDTTLWPKWVGEDTGCPVWLLGYGAAMSRWKADAMPLPRQATAVLECLSAEPSFLGGPLVLVGHSLGGLVIKTALRQGMERGVERHERLARNIRGVAFVGTPHFGSRLASMASALHLMRSNPQVSDLKMDDAHLEELNQAFQRLRGDLNVKTRVFTETQPVRIPGLLGRLLPGVTIVSPTSSQPHIPGEVGIPIEANHISICKPLNRQATIHASMVAFIKELGSTSKGLSLHQSPPETTLPSDSFDAKSPDEKPSTDVHLAFAAFGIKLRGSCDVPVCGAVCIVTDAPDRLRKALDEVRVSVGRDPLVPSAAKAAAAKASFSQLVQSPDTRAVTLRALAVISFSAYLYYCPRAAFDKLSEDDRRERLLVAPLVHRLSKKGERIAQVHTRLADVTNYVQLAVARVEVAYHRTPGAPSAGAQKYSNLEELASLVVKASCVHLGDLGDSSATELFESLRTRIRYAENVATGDKHKRDVNPLP